MFQSTRRRVHRRPSNRLSGRRAYLKNQVCEPLQDGVAPASAQKEPNQFAPKIAVKMPCRANLKAQEQVRYELWKRKASHVIMTRAEAATTVGKREASQGGTAYTATATDDAQRTAPSSTSASPRNDPNMVAAEDDAH